MINYSKASKVDGVEHLNQEIHPAKTVDHRSSSLTSPLASAPYPSFSSYEELDLILPDNWSDSTEAYTLWRG